MHIILATIEAGDTGTTVANLQNALLLLFAIHESIESDALDD